MIIADYKHVGSSLANPPLSAGKPRLCLASIWHKAGRAAYPSGESDVLHLGPGAGSAGKHRAQRENASYDSNSVDRFLNHGLSSGLFVPPTARVVRKRNPGDNRVV
jgi:hypothetical protein